MGLNPFFVPGGVGEKRFPRLVHRPGIQEATA